jgi:hypothetical protein
MNVKKIILAAAILFSLAQSSNSALPRVCPSTVRHFAKPTWKSALQQFWTLALQTLADSTLINPGQRKMTKYRMGAGSPGFFTARATIRLPSRQRGFQSGLNPSPIRPNPT